MKDPFEGVWDAFDGAFKKMDVTFKRMFEKGSKTEWVSAGLSEERVRAIVLEEIMREKAQTGHPFGDHVGKAQK